MTILHPGMGWAQYIDGDYSSGSPQSANATRTKVELNAVSGTIIETDLPRGYSSLWDSVNDKFTPNSEGDAYDIRFQFQFSRASGSDDAIELQLDIGGLLGVIWEQSITRNKINQRHSVSIPVFCADTFLDNGGTFYVDPGSSNFNIWGTQILVISHYRRGRNY